MFSSGNLSWAGFEKFGELAVYPVTPRELLAGRIADAEILLVNKTPINRETLRAAPGIRYVGPMI